MTRTTSVWNLTLRDTVAPIIIGVCYAWLLIPQIWVSGWCNDEGAHIPAGVYHLTTGRMDSYRVNPPLPRLIGALPLLADFPRMEWERHPELRVRSEYHYLGDWIARNPAADVRRQLRKARFSVSVVYIIGAVVCYLWAMRLYGQPAGWFAMSLWCLCPDIITHCAVVAPDGPAAAAGLAAGYAYWRWLVSGLKGTPWLVGVTVGMAVCTKFSWLILFPLLPAITMAFLLSSGEPVRGRVRDSLKKMSRLLLSLCLALLLLNACYGFEGTGQRLGKFQFISEAAGGIISFTETTGNRFANSWVGEFPSPVPREVLQGLDYLRWEFETGKKCYLAGEWQHGGWWYFYLYAMAVKLPLGFWFLIVTGIGAVLSRVWNAGCIRHEWFPFVMAIAVVQVVSSEIGFTHHVRYALPAYGFLFITATAAWSSWSRKMQVVSICLCLLGTGYYHARHPGISHAFFNLAAGGPENGWKHLAFSNTDWGQSSYRMADWARENSDKRPLTLLFRSGRGYPSRLLDGNAGSSPASDRRKPLFSRDREPHWFLVSSLQLTFEKNRMFRTLIPVERPWPDVLLFRIEGSVPDELRRQGSGVVTLHE